MYVLRLSKGIEQWVTVAVGVDLSEKLGKFLFAIDSHVDEGRQRHCSAS